MGITSKTKMTLALDNNATFYGIGAVGVLSALFGIFMLISKSDFIFSALILIGIMLMLTIERTAIQFDKGDGKMKIQTYSILRGKKTVEHGLRSIHKIALKHTYHGIITNFVLKDGNVLSFPIIVGSTAEVSVVAKFINVPFSTEFAVP